MAQYRLTPQREELLSSFQDTNAVFLSDLKNHMNYLGVDNSFRKFCLSMERDGFLKSFVDPMSRKKILYPTEIGLNVAQAKRGSVDKATALHDAMVFSITKKIAEFDNYQSAKIMSGIDHGVSSGVTPDAEILFNDGVNDFKIYLEVEIHQKDEKRIFEKMRRYLSSYGDFKVVYYFNKMGVFKSYKKRLIQILSEMGLDSENCSIVLVCGNGNPCDIDELLRSVSWSKGRELYFLDSIGL